MHRLLAFGAPEHTVQREQLVHASVSTVFHFFSDPMNLESITPPWLQFRTLNVSNVNGAAGTVIDYRLKQFGVSYRWRTLISTWEPEKRFVDEMVRGPYIKWHHEHTFATVDGGVLMRDSVTYRIPMGPFGELLHHCIIGKQVEQIFDYRAQKISELFGAHH